MDSPSTSQCPTRPLVAVRVVTVVVPSESVISTPPAGPSGPVIVPDIRPLPGTISSVSGAAAASAPVTRKRWVWYPGFDSTMR